MIHQCWDCESQGEIYDYEDNGDFDGSVLLTQCTRDLQPNPYTTVIKHLMKDKNE